MTVSDAIDRYITSKSAVLSPKTVAEYKRMRNVAMLNLMTQNIDRLTNEIIQGEVSAYARALAQVHVQCFVPVRRAHVPA
jgi:hypothetical protein